MSGARDALSRLVVGYQRWDQILFLHWPVAPEELRGAVDDRLALDTFEGRAYLSLTPFTVRGARLRGLPPLPRLSTFDELNLRTYVVPPEGPPGVWFFSLDAASAAAAAAARAALGLPYFPASISRTVSAGAHAYAAERRPATRRARFDARWSVGEPIAHRPGSLEHFLVERYALYSRVAGRLLRVRVRHPTWPLRAARVERLAETVSAADGLPPAPATPLAQFSDGVDVEFFPPELV